MAVQAISTFLSHHRVRRLLALGIFVLALVLLRHLATLLVFYLIFVHGLGYLSGLLAARTPVSERVWIGLILLLAGAGLGVAAYSGVHRAIPALPGAVSSIRAGADRVKHSDVYRMLESAHVEPRKLIEQVKHFSGSVIQGARATGRVLMHLLVGLILAVLFLFEREQVERLFVGLPRDSLPGYLRAFFGFTAEAILLTVKVQVIVALVNAAVTLPVLLLLGLPHIVTLMAVVLIFGLVPVVGNFLSGALLAIFSYLEKGPVGVLIFLVSTFVLHKVESYYLNPKLVSTHVKLPSLMLIVSLVVWEHLIGIAGIFVSFPALYVGLRVRDRFRELDAGESSALEQSVPTVAGRNASDGDRFREADGDE